MYTKTHKIALYFMLIHRENALKAIQHIIAHFFKNFSQGSMPPSMCAADIIISM